MPNWKARQVEEPEEDCEVSRQPHTMKELKLAKSTLVLLSAGLVAVLCGLIWLIGSSNVETPAGYVTYVREGSIFGQAKYVGTQAGPTSSGRHWLYSGQNIS